MENEWDKNSVNLSFKYVSGVEVESWIMNHESYLQNMQESWIFVLKTWESWITRLWEKLNKIHV